MTIVTTKILLITSKIFVNAIQMIVVVQNMEILYISLVIVVVNIVGVDWFSI